MAGRGPGRTATWALVALFFHKIPCKFLLSVHRPVNCGVPGCVLHWRQYDVATKTTGPAGKDGRLLDSTDWVTLRLPQATRAARIDDGWHDFLRKARLLGRFWHSSHALNAPRSPCRRKYFAGDEIHGRFEYGGYFNISYDIRTTGGILRARDGRWAYDCTVRFILIFIFQVVSVTSSTDNCHDVCYPPLTQQNIGRHVLAESRFYPLKM